MNIFSSKYRKLQDKINKEIVSLEAQKEETILLQSKTKQLLDLPKWNTLNQTILKLGYEINALKRVIQ